MTTHELISLIDTPQQIEAVLELVRQGLTGVSNLDLALLDRAFLPIKKGQIESFFTSQTEVSKTVYLELEKLLEHVSHVQLTMSAIPRTSFFEKIVGWIKKEVGGHVVIDLSIEPQLLGGATIAYNGKFRDYSLQGIWEEK